MLSEISARMAAIVQAAREAPPTTRLTGLGSGSASGNGQPRRILAPTSHYGSAPCGVASAHRESLSVQNLTLRVNGKCPKY